MKSCKYNLFFIYNHKLIPSFIILLLIIFYIIFHCLERKKNFLKLIFCILYEFY